MKKTIAFLLVLIAMGYTPRTEYKLTQGQAVMVFNALQTLDKILPTSDALSMKEGLVVKAWSDSIKNVLYKQYVDTLPSK